MSKFSKFFLITTIVLLAASFASAQMFNRAWTIPSPVGEEAGFGNVVSGMDFDGDGKKEIYAVNNNWADGANELIPKIYKYEFNSTSGQWEVVWSAILNMPLQNTWPALTYGDWDGDGRGEIIWGPANYTGPTNLNPARVVVFESAGDGSDNMGVSDGFGGWAPNAQWTITSADNFNLRPIKWQLVDIDGDLAKELVYVSRVTSAGPGNRFGVISVSDIPNNGGGTEVWTLEASDDANVIPAGTVYDMAVIGNTLYIIHDGGAVTPVSHSGSTWTIHPTQAGLTGGGGWWSAVTVDINNDMTKEILVASWTSTNRKVYLLQGSGVNITSTEIADFTSLIGSSGRIYTSDYGDIDGDGKMDFVFGTRSATPNASIIRFEYQGGNITLPASYTAALIDTNFAAGGRWMHINVSDLDGDGKDEVLYGEGTNGVRPLVILKEPLGAPVPVTFAVDMGVQVFKGLFNPATQNVVIRGDFQTAAGDPGGNWQGSFFQMTDTDGDTIYTLTVNFPAATSGNSYEHKFVIAPDTWEGAPNRPFTITPPSVTLPVRWFGNDSLYSIVRTNTIDFTADISGILGVGAGGAFDDNTDSLLVMGLNWDGLGTLVSPETDRRMIKDLFTPGIYKTSLTFKGSADSTKWKFKAFPDNRFSGGGWESGGDRWHVYGADGSTTVLPAIVPRIQPLYAPLTNNVNITFTVDLTGALNRYNSQPIPLSSLQFVGMRGAADFLGSWITGGNWLPSDTTTGHMKVTTPIGNNKYRITVTAPSGTPGGTYEYKFAAMYPGADTVNGGSSPLDNEGGFGQNHVLLLTDVPGNIIIEDVLWLTRTTDVRQIDDMVPGTYELSQNYPNPFNPSTIIRYNIPEAGFVTLRIFNALGEEVALLVNREQTAGVYEAAFNASRLSSGIYFYRIETGKFVSTKKMMLIK